MTSLVSAKGPMSVSAGMTPASLSFVAFTMIMNRIVLSPIHFQAGSQVCQVVCARDRALLTGQSDHPSDAEAIHEHAEARRPEGLRQRHLHLPAVGQCIESPLGLSCVSD